MKKRWKIAVIVDIVALAVLFGAMYWINGRTDYGVSALTGVGQFAVCYVLFQAALALLLILVAAWFVSYIRRRRK